MDEAATCSGQVIHPSSRRSISFLCAIRADTSAGRRDRLHARLFFDCAAAKINFFSEAADVLVEFQSETAKICDCRRSCSLTLGSCLHQKTLHRSGLHHLDPWWSRSSWSQSPVNVASCRFSGSAGREPNKAVRTSVLNDSGPSELRCYEVRRLVRRWRVIGIFFS